LGLEYFGVLFPSAEKYYSEENLPRSFGRSGQPL
jgi:hypothetical protein